MLMFDAVLFARGASKTTMITVNYKQLGTESERLTDLLANQRRFPGDILLRGMPALVLWNTASKCPTGIWRCYAITRIFFVLNTTNGRTFVVQGGVWVDGGMDLSP